MLEEIFRISLRGGILNGGNSRSKFLDCSAQLEREVKTDCQLPPQCNPSAVACPVADRVVAGVS